MPKKCENESYKRNKNIFFVGGMKSVHIIIIVATGAVVLLVIPLMAVGVKRR